MRGRKLFDGKSEKEVISKLEQVWVMDGSDMEACLFADISFSALMHYQQSHPDFLHRKNKLKQTPFLIARQTIIKGIKENPDLALKYLERKKSDEFAVRTKQEVSGYLERGESESQQKEAMKKVENFLNEIEAGIASKSNNNGQ